MTQPSKQTEAGTVGRTRSKSPWIDWTHDECPECGGAVRVQTSCLQGIVGELPENQTSPYCYCDDVWCCEDGHHGTTQCDGEVPVSLEAADPVPVSLELCGEAWPSSPSPAPASTGEGDVLQFVKAMKGKTFVALWDTSELEGHSGYGISVGGMGESIYARPNKLELNLAAAMADRIIQRIAVSLLATAAERDRLKKVEAAAIDLITKGSHTPNCDRETMEFGSCICGRNALADALAVARESAALPTGPATEGGGE